MKKQMLPAWLVFVMILALFLVSCTRPMDNSTILYHTEDGLMQTTPEGGRAVQVTDFGWYGEFSPDNSKIALSEGYDKGIWVANADGTNPVQLTTFGSAPSWSPDGSKLAFHVGGVIGADRSIWVMNADGSDTQRISMAPGSFPAWSPLGDQILFHAEVNQGIWSIDPDGKNERMLYRLGGYPAWSRDGKEIAYVNLEDWCIWVMMADGTGQRKLTAQKGLQPTWSADGSKIAYDRPDKDKYYLWIVNADGSEDHNTGISGSGPDWSN